MHWRLHYLPGDLAQWIVGVSTMFMLVAIVSGVIVHRKIFKDFFALGLIFAVTALKLRARLTSESAQERFVFANS